MCRCLSAVWQTFYFIWLLEVGHFFGWIAQVDFHQLSFRHHNSWGKPKFLTTYSPEGLWLEELYSITAKPGMMAIFMTSLSAAICAAIISIANLVAFDMMSDPTYAWFTRPYDIYIYIYEVVLQFHSADREDHGNCLYMHIDLCAFRMAVQGALPIRKPSPHRNQGFWLPVWTNEHVNSWRGRRVTCLSKITHHSSYDLRQRWGFTGGLQNAGNSKAFNSNPRCSMYGWCIYLIYALKLPSFVGK